MTRRVPREWHSLRYLDPERILIGLRGIERTYPLHELRYDVSSLRTHELREFGEGRQAALFCYGLGQAIGTHVAYAQAEHQDYDIVARYVVKNEINYVPVQLKEWVPSTVNPSANLQDELDKLSKYVDSKDLVVGFYLNRNASLQIADLQLPHNRIGELWFVAAADPAQEKWLLIGNVLEHAQVYEFFYPAA